MRFVADTMLGKLARWLRVLGYDTHYQPRYRPGDIDHFVKHGRIILSRHKKMADRYDNGVLLYSNHTGEQMAELKEKIGLVSDSSRWFSRCLVCNEVLKHVHPQQAGESIPDYIFYQYSKTNMIRSCPSCGRYYWPGSHREKMLEQLRNWGLS